MNRFAEEHSIENRIARVEKTLRFTGKAVLLSAVTTMIGFGSLMMSSMSPMVTFGFACVIGILFCFISATIMVPCLVLILKFEKNGRMYGWKKFAKFATEYGKRIIIVACFSAWLGTFLGSRLLKRITMRVVRIIIGIMLLLLGFGLTSGIV